MTDEHPALASFLGSAFYQGWDLYGGTAEACAEDYLRRMPPETLRAIASELAAVLERSMSRDELERFLLRECSCYHVPGGREGARPWLGKLLRAVRRIGGEGSGL